MRKVANMYFVVEIVHSSSMYSITYNSLDIVSWVVVDARVSGHIIDPHHLSRLQKSLDTVNRWQIYSYFSVIKTTYLMVFTYRN